MLLHIKQLSDDYNYFYSYEVLDAKKNLKGHPGKVMTKNRSAVCWGA